MRRRMVIGFGVMLGCAAGDANRQSGGSADGTSSGGDDAATSWAQDSGDGGPGMSGADPSATSGTTGSADESGAEGGSDSGGEPPLEPTIPDDAILVVTFDSATLGPYGINAWAQDWNDPLWQNGVSQGRVEIIGDGHSGQAMRMHHPAGAFGPDDTGGSWHLDLGGAYDALYVGFWVRFGGGFDFVKGGKLPGLTGGSVYHAGTTPAGTDGWNYRGSWRGDGAAAFQIYHMDQSDPFGDVVEWTDPATRYFEAGTWHHVQHRVVMNSPGAADGRLQAWFDGYLAVDASGLRFRSDDTLAIDAVRFANSFGGGDASYNTSKAEYVDFDDFVVSTEPILVPGQ